MTKSIFEAMKVTNQHEEILNYATSDDYIKKVNSSELKREKRYNQKNKTISSNLKNALENLKN
jgi:hypothetical protein